MRRRACAALLLPLLLVSIANAQEPPPGPPSVTLEVPAALGWAAGQLDQLVDQAMNDQHKPSLHVYFTLQNDAGDYLADRRVTFHWSGGKQEVNVPRSGMIHFDIDREKRQGLTLEAPEGFTHLRQRSIPNVPNYDPPPGIPAGAEALAAAGDLVDDQALRDALTSGISRLARSGQAVPSATLNSQRSRHTTALNLPAPPEQPLTPGEIYRLRRDSVVIIGVGDGRRGYNGGAGVVVDPSGVIATNDHVIAHLSDSNVVMGVLTRDGHFLPGIEVLATSPADDVALIRVDLQGQKLTAAPLSLGDAPGEPLTVISHPQERFYCLTTGVLSRYFTWEVQGRNVVVMSLTADYAVGSSGAPIFNSKGAVAGLATRTSTVRDQMVFKDAPTAAALRGLVEAPH